MLAELDCLQMAVFLLVSFKSRGSYSRMHQLNS